MARLFGTDGVRGVANVDLTCELSYRLGQAAASFMGKTIVVGKDTRKSGDMLEAAVVAGITSAGGDALLTGVIPTPAVAPAARRTRARPSPHRIIRRSTTASNSSMRMASSFLTRSKTKSRNSLPMAALKAKSRVRKRRARKP